MLCCRSRFLRCFQRADGARLLHQSGQFFFAQVHGIELLAQHLPSLSAGLVTLDVSGNDGVSSADAQRALVNGLRHNRTLTSLGPLDTEEEETVDPLIQHYLDLNVAGRRAFQDDIPLGAWSHLLGRVVASTDEEHKEEKNDGAPSARQANMLFSLLLGPALFER